MSQSMSDNTLGAGARLDFEAWRHLIRTMGGRFNPEGISPKTFTGWLKPMNVFGLTAAEFGCNAQRIERTPRDVRLDGVDHYLTIFQVAGQSAMTHNDRATQFDVGDVVLVDTTRPSAFFASAAYESWSSVAILLPRQLLISHLGCEPQGGIHRRGGTVAGRLLLDLVRSSGSEGSASILAGSYMRLAVLDLVGALFAPADPIPLRHAEKLFGRIHAIINDGFADPDFGPSDAAARAGISLRYLQKLFTERHATCIEFIYSLRLEHAKRLLHRRATLDSGQPLSEIAYASGFRDYAHFARKFRQRFGHTPSENTAVDARAKDGANY